MPLGNTEKAEGGHFVRQGAPRHDARRGCIPPWCVAGYYLPRTPPRVSHVSRCLPKPCHVSSSTPPPCMAGFCAFAPPCMVADPNGLVLKILSKADQIWNMFQIWAKNKKKFAAAKTQEANNPGGGCGVASWKVQTFVKPRNGMVCSPRPQLQQTWHETSP